MKYKKKAKNNKSKNLLSEKKIDESLTTQKEANWITVFLLKRYFYLKMLPQRKLQTQLLSLVNSSKQLRGEKINSTQTFSENSRDREASIILTLKLDREIIRNENYRLIGAHGKNSPANTGDIRDMDSIPGLGRSPRGGHGSPLQYSCLEDPKDRRAWRASVHSVT